MFDGQGSSSGLEGAVKSNSETVFSSKLTEVVQYLDGFFAEDTGKTHVRSLEEETVRLVSILKLLSSFHAGSNHQLRQRVVAEDGEKKGNGDNEGNEDLKQQRSFPLRETKRKSTVHEIQMEIIKNFFLRNDRLPSAFGFRKFLWSFPVATILRSSSSNPSLSVSELISAFQAPSLFSFLPLWASKLIDEAPSSLPGREQEEKHPNEKETGSIKKNGSLYFPHRNLFPLSFISEDQLHQRPQVCRQINLLLLSIPPSLGQVFRAAERHHMNHANKKSKGSTFNSQAAGAEGEGPQLEATAATLAAFRRYHTSCDEAIVLFPMRPLSLTSEEQEEEESDWNLRDWIERMQSLIPSLDGVAPCETKLAPYSFPLWLKTSQHAEHKDQGNPWRQQQQLVAEEAASEFLQQLLLEPFSDGEPYSSVVVLIDPEDLRPAIYNNLFSPFLAAFSPLRGFSSKTPTDKQRTARPRPLLWMLPANQMKQKGHRSLVVDSNGQLWSMDPNGNNKRTERVLGGDDNDLLRACQMQLLLNTETTNHSMPLLLFSVESVLPGVLGGPLDSVASYYKLLRRTVSAAESLAPKCPINVIRSLLAPTLWLQQQILNGGKEEDIQDPRSSEKHANIRRYLYESSLLYVATGPAAPFSHGFHPQLRHQSEPIHHQTSEGAGELLRSVDHQSSLAQDYVVDCLGRPVHCHPALTSSPFYFSSSTYRKQQQQSICSNEKSEMLVNRRTLPPKRHVSKGNKQRHLVSNDRAANCVSNPFATFHSFAAALMTVAEPWLPMGRKDVGTTSGNDAAVTQSDAVVELKKMARRGDSPVSLVVLPRHNSDEKQGEEKALGEIDRTLLKWFTQPYQAYDRKGEIRQGSVQQQAGTGGGIETEGIPTDSNRNLCSGPPILPP